MAASGPLSHPAHTIRLRSQAPFLFLFCLFRLLLDTTFVCLFVCFSVQFLSFIWHQFRTACGGYMHLHCFAAWIFRGFHGMWLNLLRLRRRVQKAELSLLQVLSPPVLKQDIVADLTCGCGWGILDKTYKLRSALGISLEHRHCSTSCLNCNEVYTGTE